MADAKPGDSSYRPFDRQALHASLADALKDVELADAAEPAAVPAPAAQPAAPAAPAADAGASKVPNPFGRPGASAGGAIPAPAPAPMPSAPAAPAPRTGPSILAGGISAGVSPMSASGLGGGVSGFRAPDGGYGLGGGSPLSGTGLGPRPLGPLGGTAPADEVAEPAPTIQLRRPTRPAPVVEPVVEAVPAPAAPTPARPSVPLAGWMPSDDDILPPGAQVKRKPKKRK
jgi:hypothetical protein